MTSAERSEQKPIRVLHLRDSPWVDGPGRTILESATHADPNRVQYHIGAFASDRLEGPHPLVDAARSRGLLIHSITDRGGMGDEVINQILALIDRHDIQILHTHEFRSDVLGLLCKRRRPLILMTTAHGWIANDIRGRLFRFANKTLLRWFDKVILVSRAMRRVLPRWWVPDKRVCVLHNALVLESYGGAVLTTPRRSCDSVGTVSVLNVGRLSPEKGQVLLLQVFASLLKRYPFLQLRFAGVGPLEGDLRALADTLGIAKSVHFLGYVRDMPSLYAETDLVVQSSFTEGLPNVILEAAYLRVPIVATNVGGTAEVIEHSRSGWLIAPRSFAALESAIERFLQNPSVFAAFGEQGHASVLQNFSFQARTEALMQIYEATVRERS